MDAVLCGCVWVAVCSSVGATCETPNFSVTAPTAEFARQVAEAAEVYRRELALEWTGREMPTWAARCPIRVKVGNYSAGGSTTFNFEQGEVFGWNMQIQGTAERILDSVLPHEVNHTVFACYFRRPLPRWADEGAASLIEHESERLRLKKIHEQVLKTNEKIPLRKLLSLKDYPQDTRQVLTLYAEGYSLADFLIQQGGKRKYLAFLNDAHKRGWDAALAHHYGCEKLDHLEQALDRWLLAGSPPLDSARGQLFASAFTGRANGNAVIRAQSPEVTVELGEPGEWPKSAEPVLADIGRPLRPRATPDAQAGLLLVATRRTRSDLVRPSYTVSLDHRGRQQAWQDGWMPDQR